MDEDDPKVAKTYPSAPPLETDVTERGLHETGVVDVTLLAKSLAVTEVETDHISLLWEHPAVLAEGLSYEDLTYKVTIRG